MTIIELPAELGERWWQWRTRLKRDPCAYCARRRPHGRRHTIEHVEPRRHGGADEPENIVGACGGCNSRKSDTPLLLYLLDRLE